MLRITGWTLAGFAKRLPWAWVPDEAAASGWRSPGRLREPPGENFTVVAGTEFPARCRRLATVLGLLMSSPASAEHPRSTGRARGQRPGVGEQRPEHPPDFSSEAYRADQRDSAVNAVGGVDAGGAVASIAGAAGVAAERGTAAVSLRGAGGRGWGEPEPELGQERRRRARGGCAVGAEGRSGRVVGADAEGLPEGVPAGCAVAQFAQLPQHGVEAGGVAGLQRLIRVTSGKMRFRRRLAQPALGGRSTPRGFGSRRPHRPGRPESEWHPIPRRADFQQSVLSTEMVEQQVCGNG